MAKATATDEAETRGKFRVNEKSFIGHALVQEGDTVHVHPDDLKAKGKPDGHISDNLSPLNDIAQAMIDGQKEDHPDKSKGKAAKAPRAAKDAPEGDKADAGTTGDKADDLA